MRLHARYRLFRMRYVRYMPHVRHALSFFISPTATGVGVSVLLVGGGYAAWGANRFMWAYAAFTLAFIWTTIGWIFSIRVLKLKPRALTERQKQNKSRLRAYKDTQRKYHVNKFTAPIIFCIVWLGVLYLIWDSQQEYELSQLHGILYPADDAVSGACTPQDGQLAVYLGPVGFIGSGFPLTVLTVAGKPVLTIDKNADGSLALIADIRSADDRIIVRLDRNEFTVNQNNYLLLKPRTDKSSLIVVDQYGNEAINARFANPRSFKITGILHSSGRTIDIEKTALSTPGFSSSGCMIMAPWVTSALIFR